MHATHAIQGVQWHGHIMMLQVRRRTWIEIAYPWPATESATFMTAKAYCVMQNHRDSPSAATRALL